MQYNYQIIKEHGLIIETVQGHVTLKELAEKTQTLIEDNDYDNTYEGVIDLRMANAEVTMEELNEFADYINQSGLFANSIWALLVDDPMVFALGQAFLLHLPNGAALKVFDNIESAAAFLRKPEIKDYL